MIIELHALQYFPVNNLNRDDTGAPKTTTLGGGTRARWSTQSQKRLMREAMQKIAPEHCGTRTRWLPEKIAGLLAEQYGHPHDEALDVASFLLRAIGLETQRASYGRGPDARPVTRTKVLVFSRVDTADQYAAFLHGNWDQARTASMALPEDAPKGRARRGGTAAATPADGGTGESAEPEEKAKNAARKAFEAAFGAEEITRQRQVLASKDLIDIALFGRMLSEVPDTNVDAAVSVAHAITTHVITLDFDYYTAVDDAKPEDADGVGMIGVQPYTSGVYYRYLSLDLDVLTERLKPNTDLVRLAAESLCTSFVHLRPRAKATNSAPFTRPGLLVAVAANAPHSLAASFVRPVHDDQGGLLNGSARALRRHWNTYVRSFSSPDGAPPFHSARYSVLNPDIEDIEDFSLDRATQEPLADRTITGVLESALA
ncbi:type I-E CRISPR-associated protein Cas7/Cse4/CasC [Frankia sp. Ag45/Mut15]|uniref:Type I-E CRISPR-associated protein Cas7/Cse4/CasC n=1 Tax=Frankia umida TaxID=573489 RepID=A0ABT0K384_9ACTN|nr:type I-E CRISPR-associated protein Cas7/Cse4/CasC [Frankia umida]MCK9878258.1 type I-E CRISPR-associated protein Cas7/Cse4/CasC [Frankia umida]